MKRKDAYHDRVLLYHNTTHVLGDTIHQTFRGISGNRGGKHGYLTGVQVIVSGSMTQSAATAALLKEVLWGLLDRISLEGNSHTWLSGCPGEVVIGQMLYDEYIRPSNRDLGIWADFANDQNAHTFNLEYWIPVAPKLARTGASKGPKDGMFPLEAMRDAGVFDATIVNTGLGAWALTDATTLTVKVILHCYWTDEVYLPEPWRLDTETSADNIHAMTNRLGKIDSLWVCDDDYAALTLPTGAVKVELDGLKIQDGLTGQMLEWAHNSYRLDALDDDWDNGLLPLISPQQAEGLGDFSYGSEIIVSDAAVAHLAAGGSGVRYNSRRYLPLSAEQIAIYTDLMGKRVNVYAEPNRVFLGDKPAASVNRSGDRSKGMNVKVE